jgi:hypothetical protein
MHEGILENCGTDNVMQYTDVLSKGVLKGGKFNVKIVKTLSRPPEGLRDSLG